MTKKATYSCPGLVLIQWTLNPICDNKAVPIRNYATWIRPTYMHPEEPAQSISTTVNTQDCIHWREKSVLLLLFLFFMFFLPKTQIRVTEHIALKLLQTKPYVIKTNITCPAEKPRGRLVKLV